MILITKISDGRYELSTEDSDEKVTIDRLLEKYTRKLERHIETYLVERKVNIREQENMLIMRHMSEEERAKRLKEIEGNNG